MLLDSSVLVDQLRGFLDAKRFFDSIKNKTGEVFVSVVSEAELLSGKECENEERAFLVERFLSSFQSIRVDSAVARKAGFFCRRYGLAMQGGLIAATAFVRGQPLVSKDKAFLKLREIRLIKPY